MRKANFIEYIRTIPVIFGEENVYEFKDLLKTDGVKKNEFTAQIFRGSLKLAQDKYIEFSPDIKNVALDTLLINNDEMRLFQNTAGGIELGEEITIPLMRPGLEIYGHWLLDILPKIAIFEKYNPGVSYSLLVDQQCPSWALELIAYLFSNYTSIRKLGTNEVLTGSFFFVSPIRQHDYISAMCRLDTGANNISNTIPTRKIYLSRKRLNQSQRQLRNRLHIEKLFISRGYELVYPEELSISEQVEMFNNTIILAGEAGSGLHNSIFCNKNTIIINLQSGRQNHFIQAGLCHQYEQTSIYVSGKSDNDQWDSSFKIDLEACKTAILRASLHFETSNK